MTMLELITKISFCLFAAALLGFIVGWLFSLLTGKEKFGKKYAALHDEFEVKQNELQQCEEELALKNKDYRALESRFTECQKEKLSTQMDEEDCERYIAQIKELQSENQMLISQIKEQKICEDENDILEAEVKTLEEEKQKLLDTVDEYKEYKNNYKALIMEVEALKSEKNKLLKNNLSAVPTVTSDKETLMTKEAYESILQDVLELKKQSAIIKKEKASLQERLSAVQNQLNETEALLNKCRKSEKKKQAKAVENEVKGIQPKEHPKHKKSDQFIDKEVCSDKNIPEAESEIKTLSQLIKDALNDIKN